MYYQYPKTINTICLGLIITLLLTAFFPPWHLFGVAETSPLTSTDIGEAVKAKVVPIILSTIPIMTLIFTVKLAIKFYIKERRR